MFNEKCILLNLVQWHLTKSEMWHAYYQHSISQWVECLPSVQEIQHDSQHWTTWVWWFTLSSQKLGDRTQGHPCLCTELGVRPIYIRSTQKENSRYIWFYWWSIQNSLMENRKWKKCFKVFNHFTRSSLYSCLSHGKQMDGVYSIHVHSWTRQTLLSQIYIGS